MWPQVSREACDKAQRTLVGLAAAVLIGPTQGSRLTTGSAEELAALGVMAFRSGMGPLAGWWCARGMIEADGSVADLLERHLSHNRERVLVMQAAVLRVLDAFRAANIPVTLLKGAHTSCVYFPAPETRPAADLDVLVAPDNFEQATGVLRAAGLVEVRRTVRPPRSEWMEPGVPPVVQSLEREDAASPWSIDLHRGLERWYFRGLRAGFEPRFWNTAPFDVRGQPTQGLAQPLLVAFLALHASWSMVELRLIRLVELVLVLRRDVASGTLAWDHLAQFLDATCTERFVYPAFELAERLVPGTVSEDLRSRLARAATARMRRVVDQVSAAGMQLPARSIEEQLMWARGFRETLSNMGDLLWPSDEQLSGREIARLYWRRWRLLIDRGVSWRARP